MYLQGGSIQLKQQQNDAKLLFEYVLLIIYQDAALKIVRDPSQQGLSKGHTLDHV